MSFQKRFTRSSARITNNDTPKVTGSVIGPGRTQQRESSQTPYQQATDDISNVSLGQKLSVQPTNQMKPGGFRSIAKNKSKF